MMRNEVNDSKLTLDNSQINLVRKHEDSEENNFLLSKYSSICKYHREQKYHKILYSSVQQFENPKDSVNSWCRYSYEDDGSMTPVSMNDEVPLNFADQKVKYRTFRHPKGKNLLDTTNTFQDQANQLNNAEIKVRPSKALKFIQDNNDIEKCEDIDIQFKESDSSGARLAPSFDNCENFSNEEQGCVRMLHKMVSNSLKHYRLDDVYDADMILKMFEENHILTKYAQVATKNQDMRMLSSIIDFGEKPIHFVLNPKCNEKKLDSIKITEDGILIPKKRPTTAQSAESGSVSSQHLSNKENKQPKYNDVLFIPPRPSEKVEVVTYGECSSYLKLYLNDNSNVKLSERECTVIDIEQTVTDANGILKSLKGKVARYDLFILLYLIFGSLLFGVIGFIFGYFIHFAISIVFGITYFVILGFAVYFYKKKTKDLIIQSHFCLSLFLHAENFRYYLNHRIRFRPGFMAKWIEIYYIPEKK